VSQGTLTLIKKGKPKEYVLSDYLASPIKVEERDGCVLVTMSLRSVPTGSLRPEQIINAACAEQPVEVRSVTRMRLEEEGARA
jgi:hypothetical protein